MTRVTWNNSGDRRYQLGVDRGVLYVDDLGAPWNGLVSVDVAPIGGATKSYYQDGIAFATVSSREEFAATINAFHSPTLFDQCDGSGELAPGVLLTQQRRKPFSFTYRTKIGNDLNENLGHKIHLVYNAMVAPSQRNYTTKGDNPEAMTLSWEVRTRPVLFSGMAPSAHIEIDTTQVSPTSLAAFEDILYGTEMENPRLPTPAEVASIFTVVFTVIDNGNGTFTISGTDAQVTKLNTILYAITADTVVPSGPNYTISD